MKTIEAESSVASGGGWLVRVKVSAAGSSGQFKVSVTPAELSRLDPGASDPADLVRRSFEFLLAREPMESILPEFAISVISRYFPEFESDIKR